jgi:inner membrane protein
MIFGIAAHWLWISAGLLLLAAEVMAPGVLLVWIGLAAITTGLIVWLLPLPWTAAIIIFCVGAVSAALLGRKLMGHRSSTPADAPHLHRRGDALVGRVFTLETAITTDAGSVRVDDTVWRVTGDPMEKGERVRVSGIEGATLTVVKA